jgi:hypothetical protein
MAHTSTACPSLILTSSIEVNESTGMLARPVFLVACERSGTTLMSILLDHHPQLVFFDGYFSVEILPDDGGWPDLNEYYEFLETNFVFQNYSLSIDKSLDYPHLVDSFLRQMMARSRKSMVGAKIRDNFQRVLRIWPDARFIHLIRDGRDVARSIVGMGWAGNAFHAAEYWLRAEEMWDRLQRLIAPEQYIEVRYQELISNPEPTLNRICAFLGVPPDAAMLDYPKDTTYDPLSPELVDQWKRTMAPEQVRLAEACIRDKLVERGYEPSGLDRLEISPLMKVRLSFQDRWYRATFRRRRYGMFLYLAELITRRVGPRRLRAAIQDRWDEITRRYLK